MRLIQKRKGSAGLLLSVFFSGIIMSIIAAGVATVNSSQFRTNVASSIALQSRVLAESKYESLKNKGYDNLEDEARAVVADTEYEREVIVGAESENEEGYKERDVTINVYKAGETEPRYSLPLSLSAQGSGNEDALLETDGYIKLSNGLIVQWGTANSGGGFKNFPIPFEKTIFSYTATRKHTSASFPNGSAAVGTASAVVSLNGIRTYAREADGGEFRSGFPVNYMVIGQ